MGWQTVLFDLALALFFLFLVGTYGYLEQRILSFGGLILSWNLNDNLVASTLLLPLMVLITGILLINIEKKWLIVGLWLVGLIFVLIRATLVLATNRLRSMSINFWIIGSVISVILCFVFNWLIIYSENDLKINRNTVAIFLWTIVGVSILYLLLRLLPKQLKDVNTNRLFIGKMYLDYYGKYSKELTKQFKTDPILHRIFFAILITEDLNRPAIFRYFERLAFPLGIIKTTGIMQVTNDNALSDSKSVVLAQDLIGQYYSDVSAKNITDYNRLKDIAYLYNDGDYYVELILYSYFTLTELGAFKGSISST